MTKYTEKDVAKETGASGKETARAWHKAKDDAAEEGGWGVPKNRHGDNDDNGGGGGGGGCFVATAIYNDFNAPQVKILRKFRDELLLKSIIGRFFVQLYYQVSPPVANFIERHTFLKNIFKLPLNIFVRIIK